MAGVLEAIMDHQATLRTEEPGSLRTSRHCHPSPGLPTPDLFYRREYTLLGLRHCGWICSRSLLQEGIHTSGIETLWLDLFNNRLQRISFQPTFFLLQPIC